MRGGRGRGRGGRGGRGSVTQDLLRDNLEDLGLEYQGTLLDNKPPPLYPPISLQPPQPLSQEQLDKVKLLREISHRFQTSPFHLVEKKQDKDIARYSDKYRMNGLQINVINYISDGVVDMSRYIPPDLLDISDASRRSGKLRRKRKLASVGATGDDLLRLQRLEQQENGTLAGEEGGAKEKESGEGGDVSDADAELGQEGDLEDDYGVDHYASDDGFGGSGDDEEAEAVF